MLCQDKVECFQECPARLYKEGSGLHRGCAAGEHQVRPRVGRNSKSPPQPSPIQPMNRETKMPEKHTFGRPRFITISRGMSLLGGMITACPNVNFPYILASTVSPHLRYWRDCWCQDVWQVYIWTSRDHTPKEAHTSTNRDEPRATEGMFLGHLYGTPGSGYFLL